MFNSSSEDGQLNKLNDINATTETCAALKALPAKSPSSASEKVPVGESEGGSKACNRKRSMPVSLLGLGRLASNHFAAGVMQGTQFVPIGYRVMLCEMSRILSSSVNGR